MGLCAGEGHARLYHSRKELTQELMETRESGALPPACTGAEMLPGSWAEPISPNSALAHGLVLLWTLGSGKDAQALLQESSAPLGFSLC